MIFKESPIRKGDGELQPLYPRIANKGTIKTEHIISDISQMSSFTEGDVAGLLAAFEERISRCISEGHRVQLGNMGLCRRVCRTRQARICFQA